MVASLLGCLGAGKGAGWPNGSDGALSLNGTTLTIAAGSVKDYSSISIINNGHLRIVDGPPLGGTLATNDGTQPTIIGCAGNCTINTGGKITALNCGLGEFDYGAVSYQYNFSKVPPAGAVVTPISFTATMYPGGEGGSCDYGSIPGADAIGCGQGGGGAGYGDGGETSVDIGWGKSGSGTESSTDANVAGGLNPFDVGFGYGGEAGTGGETAGVDSIGGGGSGGVRGYCGGCIYLQVGGTLSVSGSVIHAYGSSGGVGGNGGPAATTDGATAYGGGGGAGASGGSGGKVIVRYRSGSILSTNINVLGGPSGSGGEGGLADSPGGGAIAGGQGSAGTNGPNGSVDLATY